MAQRSIREFHAKDRLHSTWQQYLPGDINFSYRGVLVGPNDSLEDIKAKHPWVNTTSLVVKPDMLFGKRGKNGLVYVKKSTLGDVTINDAWDWIQEKRQGEVTLDSGISGELDHFLIEPFFPHEAKDEWYVAFRTDANQDTLLISSQGGVDVEENWDQVQEVAIPLTVERNIEAINTYLSTAIPSEYRQGRNVEVIAGLYQYFLEQHFTYLEINPIVLQGNDVHCLDMVARLDDTANFLMNDTWNDIPFPAAFGETRLTPEEKLISEIDEVSGSSLKLTILNPKGQIWTLVAGGGASVVYADTIANQWSVEELANYGEYSGNPSTQETYTYTRTILDLMTREKHQSGADKILLIGGAIANFTDVAKTFAGIIQAFEEFADKMKKVGVRIYVRRGGPNYEVGLKNIRVSAKKLGLPIEVYGPETHITDIVKISYEDSLTA